ASHIHHNYVMQMAAKELSTCLEFRRVLFRSVSGSQNPTGSRLFRRDPVGFWLPETAVDRETLDVLAAEGIQFTVLAPHQVSKPPAHGLPARIELSGGRSIAVFVYDGGLSHDVAFGPLTTDADRLT